MATMNASDYGSKTLFGGKSFSSYFTSPNDYNKWLTSVNDANAAAKAVNDWRSSADSGLGGLNRQQEFDTINANPLYQDYTNKQAASRGMFESAWKNAHPTGWDSNQYGQSLQDFNNIYDNANAGVRTPKNSFLSKVGGTLANTIHDNPWVVALPMASAVAAPYLAGTAAAGTAGTAGTTAASTGTTLSSAGSTLSSAGNWLSNALKGITSIPGQFGSYVSGATGSGLAGDVAAGALKGAVLGGGTSGLTGGNIGQGIVKGALLGGVGGGASSVLNGTAVGDFLGLSTPSTEYGPFTDAAKNTSWGESFGPYTDAAKNIPKSGFSNLAKTLGITGGGSSLTGGSMLPMLIGGINDYAANKRAIKDLTASGAQAQALLNPYIQSGNQANSRLSDLLGLSSNAGAAGYGSLSKQFTAPDLANDPGYQFQLEQGNKALDRRAAAGGGYFSGAALKAAQDYGQGLASTTFNDAYNRDVANKSQLYSMLSGQSGTGLNAANAGAGLATDIGSAKANATMGSAGNISNLIAALYGRNLLNFG
jgi:hypothetical protein